MPYRPSAEVEAIVARPPRRSVCFSRHAPEFGRSLRPGVPARCRERLGRRKRDRPDRRALRAHPSRPGCSSPAWPIAARCSATGCGSDGAGTSRNSRTSIVSDRCSANSTCTCSSRATISPAIRSSARIRSCMRASRASGSRSGRRTRNGSASSAISTTGTAGGCRCGGGTPAVCGRFSCPGCARGTSINTS